MAAGDDSKAAAGDVPASAGTAASVQVVVDAKIYNSISHQAKEELQSKLEALAAVVLAEAQSLESVDRAAGASPEIIRPHVERAWWHIMLLYKREKHSGVVRVLPVFSSLCGVFIGFGISHFKDWWGGIVFAAATVLAAICIAVLYILAGHQ